MQSRRLGATDVTISLLVFGAFAIGGWYWGKSVNVLVGARNRSQIRDNPGAVDVRLSQEELRWIGDTLTGLELDS